MVCRVLNIPISRLGFSESLEVIQSWKKGGAFYFVNVHLVVEAQTHVALRDALGAADLNFADGVPLVWSSRLKGEPIQSRVCGPDFMKALLETNVSSAVIGGNFEALQTIQSTYSSSVIATYSPPYRPFDPKNVVEDLKELRKNLPVSAHGKLPRYIWVGLGAPKQELWIQEAHKIEPDCLFFGIGAAVDFLAGAKPRAPLWMQKFGLEWFFRLCSEPRRLWKRYLVTNSKFIFLSMKEWLGLKNEKL